MSKTVIIPKGTKISYFKSRSGTADVIWENKLFMVLSENSRSYFGCFLVRVPIQAVIRVKKSDCKEIV